MLVASCIASSENLGTPVLQPGELKNEMVKQRKERNGFKARSRDAGEKERMSRRGRRLLQNEYQNC